MPFPEVLRCGVLALVGNTPLVDVSVLSPSPRVRLLAKLEGQNPFGSVKDRIALAMVEDAYTSGRLAPGQRLVESSSGNTGIALAAIARVAGNPLTVLLPENVSHERRALLEAFGAEVVLTPAGEGSNGALRRAEALAAAHPEWCMLHQYANDANPRAHYRTTGPEIWSQTGGEVTHFVAGLGTGGTLAGVGRFLKEQDPGVRLVAVEPPSGELVEGLRNLDDGYVPPVFTSWGVADLLDRRRIVRPRESVEMTRRLAVECGIFAGVSSGASLAGALKVAAEVHERGVEAVIVFVVCDGGWKYLSTGAFTADLDGAVESVGKVIYF
jgi:cysteine synthase B